MSLIGPSVIRVTYTLLALRNNTPLAEGPRWCNKGSVMYCHAYVVTNIKGPQLFFVKVGHGGPVAGFCMFL